MISFDNQKTQLIYFYFFYILRQKAHLQRHQNYCRINCPENASEKNTDKVHEGKTQKCEFCIKSFFNKSSLKRHINTFHTNSSNNDSKNQKKYKCQWCVKTFTCSNSLKRHISAFHQGQMPTCYICCKLFFNASKLIQHEMKEHGIKSKPKCKDYKCDICEKLFTKLHNLNVHKRMHGNVYPFGCSICGQKFRYENYFL